MSKSRKMWYKLHGQIAFETDDSDAAMRSHCHVNETFIGDVHISTVFLGLNHNYFGGKPLLYETMIFGGKYNGQLWRYPSWTVAKRGHKAVVRMIKNVR